MIERYTTRDPMQFSPNSGWEHGIVAPDARQFFRRILRLNLDDEIALRDDSYSSTFHVEGKTEQDCVELLFFQSMNSENSRIMSYRHVTSGVAVSFGGNYFEAVGDTAARASAINFTGASAQAVIDLLSPQALALAQDRKGYKPMAIAGHSDSSRSLDQRIRTLLDKEAAAAARLQVANGATDDAGGVRDSRQALRDYRRDGLVELAANAIEQLAEGQAPSDRTIPGQRYAIAREVARILSEQPNRRHADWSLPEVAERVKVSQRLVQIAMQETFGLGFVAYRRLVRLYQLRRSLLTSAPGTRIIDLAYEHFFFNPGRMAQLYEDLFGLHPFADRRQLHLRA